MQIPEILKNRVVQVAVSSVTTFVGGLGLGYFLGKRNGSITIVPPEKNAYDQLSLFDQEKGEFVESPAIQMYDPEFEALLAEEDEIEKRTVTPVKVVNVFANPNSTWNYDDELSQRSKELPYVIHIEEFVENSMDYRQETLTYYEGDNIMADASDTCVYNHNGLMGELKFGHGSNDPNVVYIRNEGIHMEWEILRHTGHYSIEVLGHTAEDEIERGELKHSVQKFRRE